MAGNASNLNDHREIVYNFCFNFFSFERKHYVLKSFEHFFVYCNYCLNEVSPVNVSFMRVD